MPGIGFSGVANGAFTTTGKASGIGGINSGSAAGAGVGGTGVTSTFVTAPPAPTVIGQAFGGGYYAGQISTAGNGIANYYLIVAPVSTGQTSGPYKTSNTDDPGATSVIDGPANSIAINDANHPLASFCKGLTIGGYTDWYMAARYELQVCYFNLKPTTTGNDTGTGANPYSVPTRASNYTSGSPAQTTATDFQSGGAQPYTASVYSVSNQASSSFQNRISFSNGATSVSSKTVGVLVRAVRRVPV